MRVSSVSFLHDGTVGIVTVVAALDEYEYILKTTPPVGLVYPVVLEYTAEQTAVLFHRAGKVSGLDPDYHVSLGIYEALAPVVDRLIEWEAA